MRSASATNTVRNECDHSNSIDDEREGTNVCIDCGLVLDQLYFPSRSAVLNEHDYSAPDKIFLFLKDVCGNAFIADNIIYYAYNYFNHLKKDMSIIDKKFKDTVIASYALYETLCRHGNAFTAKEIAYYTGTPCNYLWKVENCLHMSEMLHNPQDFVERYCAILKIDFYTTKIIKGIAGNMYALGDIRPSCVVSAVIYLYCVKEIKMKLTMKDICEVCDVSTGNIYKICNRLLPMYRNKISLLYT
jgi:transcription initiation factor TFIIIB Brf1 subunit/transcription initiation factor TFIIB